MAHLDYSERFEEGRLTALVMTTGRLLRDWYRARRQRHAVLSKQWEDRQAFKNLLGKEDWVYRDMGIHRGDVEFLANEPLDVNASAELERMRLHYRKSRYTV
ncbi:MAG: hypothetical protein AAGI92_02590 [Pseudomonadota bacterium]